MPYLRIWDLVLPPPGPAAVTIGIVAALFGAGAWLVARWSRNTWMHRTAAFVVVSGSVGAVVHLLAVVGLIRVLPLRVAGWGLAVAGWIWIGAYARPAWATARGTIAALRATGALERSLAALTAVVGLCWAAASLGPATDADSLAYHLAAGLEWLRAGRVEARTDWMNFRLVGIGEGLSALGLAAGTDGVSAAVQCVALLACAAAIGEEGRDALGTWLGACLLVSVPLMAFLVPNQKPQLMPAVGVAVAGLMAVRRYGVMDGSEAALAFGSLFVAVASKHSFLLTGAAAGLLLLASGRRSARPLVFLGIGLAAFAVLALPVYVRNWQLYGDPLSPFLERFRPSPDASVVAAASYYREAALKPTLGTLLRLPIDLTIAWRPAELPSVLGIGAFAFVPALVGGLDAARRRLLAAALGATVLVVALGQLAGRYFVEPYVWAAAAAAAARASGPKKLFAGAVVAQAALTAAMAAYAGVSLFPGAMSSSAREHVMQRSALNYAEARWMDAVLPRDAVVLAQVRSVSLLPRPWLGAYAIAPASDPARTATLVEAVRSGAVTALVLNSPSHDERFEALAADCGSPAAPPLVARYATRNPFNRGAEYQMRAFNLDPSSHRCRRTLARMSGSPR